MSERIRHIPRPYSQSESPARLLAGLDAARLFMLKRPGFNLEGQENLLNLPPDVPTIVVTTHLTDYDVPIAASYIGRHRNIAIANTVDQHNWREPVGGVLTRLLGRQENFIPISASPGKSRSLVHRDFVPMVEALDTGKTLVIAGHNTAYVGHLEDRPGYGAAYLQALTGAVILPVAVDIGLKKYPKNAQTSFLKIFATSPRTTIKIGEPIIFPIIENIEERLMSRSRGSGRPEMIHELRRRAGIIATVHAELLPVHKQGRWGSNPGNL